MAYGLKWFSEFSEFDTQKTVRVEIHERDYSGLSKEVISGGKPLVIRWADDYTDNPFEPMRPQNAAIEWIASEDFDIQSLFITDEKQYQVKISRDLNVIWWGYVSFTDCQEPYHDYPYPVTISAECGLSFLQKHEILDQSGRWHTGPIPPIRVISDGLSQTGLNLWIRESVNLAFIAWLTPNAAYPMSNTTIDGDGLRGLNYYDYIRGMLNACGAFITQVNGVWVINDVRNQTEPTREYRVFDASGAYVETIVEGQHINIIPPGEEGTGNYLRPTEDVVHRLALPKSKVVCEVDPGLPVNRLVNGDFHLNPLLPGSHWVANAAPPYGHGREGDGRPGDPYRWSVRAFSSKGLNGILNWIKSDPIIINVEGSGGDGPCGVKLRFYGSIKTNDIRSTCIVLKMHELSEKRQSFLSSDGEWHKQKFPSQTDMPFEVVIATQTQAIKGQSGDYSELATQDFDVTSEEISHWYQNKITGEWYAAFVLTVAPGFPIMNTMVNPNTANFFEDLRIEVTTNTPYERTHEYELDATTIILNGEEYRYRITLAEKYNIKTLEQRRDVNRVMTNYLMAPLVLPGQTLYVPTGGFYRLIGPDHNEDPHDPASRYPLQHLGMKERIRLLCGKRSLLEGTFFGYGLRPNYSLVNTLLDDGTKYIPTSWEWNVKDAMHGLSMRELDFKKLDNEDIDLVVEDESGNRRRLAGAAGSGIGSSSNSSSKEPLFLGDIPLIAGREGRYLEALVVVSDFIESDHDPSEIDLRLLTKPSWVNVIIDNETKEVTIKGVPDIVGDDQVLIEVTDSTGDDYTLSIPITIYPAPSLTYTLSPGGKLIPGQPAVFPQSSPIPRTLTVQAKGGHEAYRWVHRYGGQVQYDSDIIPVTYTENATYTPINSQTLAQGIHVVFFQLLRKTGVDENDDPIYTTISGDDLIFKLGTAAEDPDRTVKLELVSGGATLGEIPNTFEYTEEWDIVPTPKGIRYDELFLSILPEEEPYTNTLTPTLSPAPFALEPEILDGSDGTTSPDAGYVTTDAISVSPGQEYWLESAPYSAVGYNSGSYVTELSGEVIIIPAGVNQVRICWANGSITEANRVELTGTLFGGDAPKGAGNFTVFARARLAGSQVYERMENFTILEKEPAEPVEQEGITLIQPGNPIVILVDPIPIEGLITTLPPSFGLLFSGFGTIPYDKITWKLFHGMAGMSEVSLPLYTGQASEKSYNAPVTAATQLLFWGKTSLDIGNIHQAPNRLLVEVTGWLKGSKVAVAKADWIFSNTPIGPGSGMAYGYYDPVANDFSLQVSNVPTTGGIYPLLDLEERDWVVGSGTWNSSTQYNKRETEVNGIIVKTWAGALTATNTNLADFLDWNRSTPGLDEPGDKTIIERFYNGAALIGTKQAVITLYSKDPDIKDPNECCSGGGSQGGIIEVEFSPASTLWVHNHGLGYEASGIPVIDNEEWATKITFSPDKNTTYYHWNSPRAGKIVLTL